MFYAVTSSVARSPCKNGTFTVDGNFDRVLTNSPRNFHPADFLRHRRRYVPILCHPLVVFRVAGVSMASKRRGGTKNLDTFLSRYPLNENNLFFLFLTKSEIHKGMLHSLGLFIGPLTLSIPVIIDRY